MVRWVMVVDLSRCVGCNSCTIACKSEHGTPPGVFWRRVLDTETGVYPLARREFLSVACNHCGKAPCVQVCPTGATYKRPDGIVMVDQRKCIGCEACVIACPYQARFRWNGGEGYYGKELTPYEQVKYARFQKGTVQKCNFCYERLDRGEPPACVEACPAKALTHGDFEDRDSPVHRALAGRRHFRPREELGTEPHVFYLT